MYGWRARLGVLVPSGIIAIEPEFGLVTPAGVSCHYHRFNFSGAGRDDEEVVARLRKAEDGGQRQPLTVERLMSSGLGRWLNCFGLKPSQ